MTNWHLINIVNNDFHQTHGIFDLFDRLSVPNLDEPVAGNREAPPANGGSNEHGNGVSGIHNGTHNEIPKATPKAVALAN
jgi:methylenetetrahydrofolate reductase (NADPH)